MKDLRQRRTLELTSINFPTSSYYNHMSLGEVLRLQGEAVFNYRVACIERNPYSKIISWANHELTFDRYKTGGRMLTGHADLKLFLAEAIKKKLIVKVRNIDRYKDLNSAISARVMRFDNLDEELTRFVQDLGIVDYLTSRTLKWAYWQIN